MPSLIINGRPATLAEQHYSDFHGHSVFTTLRSQAGDLMLWPRHWQRLNDHAHFFGYAVPAEGAVLDVIREYATGNQKIRIIIASNRFAITIEDYLAPPSVIYDGVKTVITAFNIHPQLGGFKTGSSLPYALALKEAQDHGAFEGLLTDVAGFLVDGSRSSLMHFDGVVLTSLIGGLDGCMRAHVLSYARAASVPVQEKQLKAQDIYGQLLLANSLFGVVPVDSIKYDFVSHLVNKFRMDIS